MLAHQRLGDPSAARLVVLLHGILGRGQNWRSFAQALVRERPAWGAVLVDLRAHGGSRDVPPPDDLDRAAADVAELVDRLDRPAPAVLGHSFGGKVALAYAATRPVEALFVVDALPGARPDRRGSEGTMAVLDTLDALPATFPTRQAFVEHIVARGHREVLGRWLAMNLDPANGAGYRFGLDVGRVRRLLDDYFTRDLWSTLPPSTGHADLVIAGLSTVFGADERAAADRHAAASGGRLRVHVLEDADHWVHVDDPEGLLRIVLGGLDGVR
ncbi:MAG: alpha/beta fold hydrolase [Sandaracinaceae bacterium]